MQSHLIPDLANTSTKLQKEIQIHTTEDELDAVLNQGQQEDSTSIQISVIQRIQLQSQIRSLEYNNPEVRSHIQSPVTAIQIQRFLPDAEIGDVDWNAPNISLQAALGMIETEAVNRPPPKPPNLPSVPVSSGAEDGAVAKGKVVTQSYMAVRDDVPLWPEDAADLAVGVGDAKARTTAPEAKPQKTIGNRGFSGARVVSLWPEDELLTVPCWTIGDERRKATTYMTKASSAAHGAFAEGMWTTTVENGVTKMRGGGCAGVVDGSASMRKRESSFCRRLILTAKPPPLLAAFLPWDRESGFGTEKRWDEVLSQWVAAGRGGDRGAPRTDESWTEAHAENYLRWRGVSVEGLAAGDGAVQRKE